jgi:hypothetical protein
VPAPITDIVKSSYLRQSELATVVIEAFQSIASKICPTILPSFGMSFGQVQEGTILRDSVQNFLYVSFFMMANYPVNRRESVACCTRH